MLKSRITKFLSVIFSTAVAIGIFLNPLTCKSADVSKVKMFSQGINEIIKSLGLSHSIGFEGMIDIIIFVEYSVFGLSLMFVTKSLYENTLKNIFFPLFVGLFLSTAMGYYGYKNKGLVSGINSVAVMFCGVLLGITIYMLMKFIFLRGRFNSLGKKSNYKRER